MRQRTRTMLRSCAALALSLVTVLSLSTTAFAGRVEIDTSIPMMDSRELKAEWKKDQTYTLANPAPWNLEELKQVVDVQDPRSVAAYWVWAVNRLVDNYDDGMGMMKYLFADIEPFGPGFTEGGMSGQAGWSTYFNERLRSTDYKWLPRAYFEGGTAANGFRLPQPLVLELYYNNTNTETINAQTLDQMGRLNIVYWVKSHAGGHQMNITLSKFEASNRWYVTSGTSSTALFYDQRFSLKSDELAKAKAEILDYSTAEEHAQRYAPKEDDQLGGSLDDSPAYSGVTAHPFTDVDSAAPFASAVAWAYGRGVTRGISETRFGVDAACTHAQALTFLWAAEGRPSAPEQTLPGVAADAYYRQALLWALDRGIVDAEAFLPGAACKGDEFIAYLYAAKGLGASSSLDEAQAWAEASGLLKDIGLAANPEAPCSRTDAVTLLYRVCGS